ncbi:putative pentatricopeptide repeat-containing protein At3g47840 [Brachypodium distachyon]|uniref:putative pentatricopeptide repeat-containing protein At3g47840 n=1 Tax=Brachypodium distachyon TaxID=15368 RepID=UPI000D0D69DA|nr:putative pentatricopeptide repeat-containing protein At3g47840 [Brachypodium distachyon]|eukprot:XP_024314511.1 putative pentatricopeptide repeat-containing protein At3g47840 [Brachypodium distachyon]
MALFARLRRTSSPPLDAADPFVLSLVFKASASDPGLLLPHAASLHAFAVRSSALSSVFVATALADAYAMAGRLELALRVFDEMPSARRNVVSWTTLVAALSRAGRRRDALRAFAEMRASAGVACDSHAYAAALNVAQRGFANARSVANSLVTLYAHVAGRLSAADAVFQESAAKDVVSWSAIISGYAQEGLAGEAFALFTEMRRHHCPRPNEFTLASLLSVCATAATLDAGRQLHALVMAAGLEHHAMIRSALVDMYGKSGSMSDADVVFSNRTKDDVVSWTAMIVGHAEHGQSKRALELFEEMCLVGLKPDHVAFIAVLSACCHAGEVELGLRYLSAMSKIYGLEPAKELYGCVVDLLGRAGRINEAEELIGRMKEMVLFGHLCLGRVQLEGKRRPERKLQRGQWRQSHGVQEHMWQWQIYTPARDNGVRQQERHMMKQKGVVKGVGWSSITVGGGRRIGQLEWPAMYLIRRI